MRKTLRFLLLGLAGLFLLLLLGLGGGWLWLNGSLPQTEGELRVQGATGPVALLRDADGLLTVRADSRADAAFGLGFAHAQDRLAQMIFTRRLGQGRLSELIGESTLRMDEAMRALDLARLSRAALAYLQPETLTLLEAYAAGVNAYLDTREGPLPPELVLLGVEPAPWRPEDSLLWGKLMALRLSGNWREELLQASLSTRLSPAQIGDLFPDLDPGSPSTISGAALAQRPPSLFAETLLAALPPGVAADGASNAWVVAGERTESGKPLLANDPHLRLQVPSLWYLARLETPEGVVAGATAPGVPAVVIGHNGTIAWGFTTTHSDTQDLVIETLVDGDPTRYRTPDGPRAFETETVEIAVRGEEEPRRVTLRRGRFGPVVTPALLGEDAAPLPPDAVLTLAWPALREADTSADALIGLNRARNWDDFVAAMARFVSPQQNVFYADVAGNIGFYTPGLVPIRAGYDGSRPVEGRERRTIWSGFIPFAELPQALNPEAGRLVNANNRIVGPDYPYRLATDWPDPYRARRIEERLAAANPHSPDKTARLQLDEVSPMARDLLPLMLRAEPEAGAPAAAHALLAAWDGDMARERREPLLFYAWLKALTEVLFADELGPVYPAYATWRPRAVERVLRSAPAWCRGGAADCDAALRLSLRRALDDLAARGLAEATWGEAHRVRFAHPLLRSVPLLGDWLTLELATGGGEATINRAPPGFDGPHAFEQEHGPSLRAVFDLADLDASSFIIAPGQSGNLLSRHYGDLAERWRDGGAVKLVAPAQAAARRLRLIPR